ncbi:MAG TPA: FHA domain-containing protein [Gammaproteobacteria bacterium]
MAKLQILFHGEVIDEMDITKDTMTIGRKSDCDIHLDNLAVSGHHARIVTVMNDSFIEDTNSTNGTYLNGSLIKKQQLSNNDVIKVGKHDIKFINDGVGNGSFEHTMIINPASDGLQETEGSAAVNQSVNKLAAEIASSGTSGSQQKALIKITSGTNSGKELPLTKVLTTLGKPGVQVAAITRRPTGYFLIHIDGGDNSSRPRVNDMEIGTSAQELKHGDVIEVAGVKMQFMFE